VKRTFPRKAVHSARFIAAAACALAAGCGTDRLELKIDFRGREFWRYLLKSEVAGAYHFPSGQRNFSNVLTAVVTIRNTGRGSGIEAGAESVTVLSDIFGEEERKNLERQVQRSRIAFSLKDGVLGEADSAPAPFVQIGQWDVYRSIVHTMPALPGEKVGPGDSWERQREFPIETGHGRVRGLLYQLFTFDSLETAPEGKSIAHIGWNFSYRLEPVPGLADSVFREIPMEGHGWGRARINTGKKYLENARMEIEVHRPENEMPGLSWIETVNFCLEEKIR
jgi:hypothetical protein